MPAELHLLMAVELGLLLLAGFTVSLTLALTAAVWRSGSRILAGQRPASKPGR